MPLERGLNPKARYELSVASLATRLGHFLVRSVGAKFRIGHVNPDANQAVLSLVLLSQVPNFTARFIRGWAGACIAWCRQPQNEEQQKYRERPRFMGT